MTSEHESQLVGGAGEEVLPRLRRLLRERGIAFSEMHHAPVFTSAEAAAIRGTPLKSGAKALIIKSGDEFVMVVMPADLSLDSKALRAVTGSKQIRFATLDEVLAMTGLRPGSIPPFGSLFQLATICDDRLAKNESINFNAGSHTDSIQMSYAGYIEYESPRIMRVAKASTAE